MKHLPACLLLVAATAAGAKPSKAPAKVAVSTAAAGAELPSHAPSNAPLTVDVIAARFAETDAMIKTLKTSFRQFVRLEGSDTVQSVEGDVVFKKPDLLRLNHRVPEPQTIVSDGTWLWVYRKSTNQVIQTRLDAWSKSEPLAQGLLDFGRSADLLARYKTEITTVSAPGADGHRQFVLTLTPKPADVKNGGTDFTLTLKADTRRYFPGDATLRVGRVSIHSIFDDVRINPDISEEVFRFVPPTDADLFKSPEPRP
jgi:outer membrane lipoprotein carrier protein